MAIWGQSGGGMASIQKPGLFKSFNWCRSGAWQGVFEQGRSSGENFDDPPGQNVVLSSSQSKFTDRLSWRKRLLKLPPGRFCASLQVALDGFCLGICRVVVKLRSRGALVKLTNDAKTAINFDVEVFSEQGYRLLYSPTV